MYTCSIVWLRRDLRIADHAALEAAARRSERVVLAFVLDPDLLRGPRVGAPIVQFFFDSLRVLREHLRRSGSDLALLEGDFGEQLATLAAHTQAQAVFYNVDYDPEMLARDERVAARLRTHKLDVHAFVDHVYAAADEVVQQSGKPYTVYTPYRKRWQAAFEAHPRAPFDSEAAVRGKLLDGAAIGPTRAVPAPEVYGHQSSDRFPAGGFTEAQRLLETFIAAGSTHISTGATCRPSPAPRGCHRIARRNDRHPRLRVRRVGGARTARREGRGRTSTLDRRTDLARFLSSCSCMRRALRRAVFGCRQEDRLSRDDAAVAAWTAGATGYPIVDAAMVQLNTTGWMHNRLRMIVASFLTKHLLLDYRHGERYFEQHLADADLAANNGGWQWSASTGTDAAPYFRVFNPTLQGKTFDPGGAFVRAMIPALARVPDAFAHEPWTMPPLVAAAAGVEIGRDYPRPIVDHAAARQRALDVYGAAFKRR